IRLHRFRGGHPGLRVVLLLQIGNQRSWFSVSSLDHRYLFRRATFRSGHYRRVPRADAFPHDGPPSLRHSPEGQGSMKERLNVLVLGVGGNVSQGILKALKVASIPCRVIGGCVSPLSMGLYTVDQAYVSPAANHASFFEWLVQTCKTERVDAVLSGVEPVLEVLSVHADQLRAETGAVAIVSAPGALEIGADKLRTCKWLREHG